MNIIATRPRPIASVMNGASAMIGIDRNDSANG